MSESILQIRPVKREAAKLVIGLAGQSGEGKTFSALQIALGLAGGDPSKVGLLDTENRRGSVYSDIFDLPGNKRPFMIGDLVPPFSPARYITAMREFSNAGIEALVIDSTSHEWEGEGGCEEIAQNPSKRIADWLTAKREHKRFMNALLFLPCHVIACFRAREKTSFKDPKNPVSLGIQPITEKNVLFEMTASLLVSNRGYHRSEIKIPRCLHPILGSGEVDGYLTEDHGRQLRDWVGGADPIERSKNILRLAASSGTDALKAAFVALDKPTKHALNEFKDTLKDLAAHADAEKAAIKGDNGAPDTDMHSEDQRWN